jgi:arylsulfatase A-like enzyme
MLRVARFFAVLILGAGWLVNSTQAEPNYHSSGLRPVNIVLILADDLGYGDLGCYGQDRIQTPNIDNLAKEGMRFTSCYAGSTVCAPSRAALMTGKDTGHGRIRGNSTIPLAADDLTMAELLRGAGYRTAAIGKWGLGEGGSSGVPGKKGFDEWVGYLNQVDAHNYYPEFLYRSGEGHDERMPIFENHGGKKGKYADDLFTDSAVRFLKFAEPDKFNHYRPFFLYLAYTIPHANNELGAITHNGMEVPSDEPYSNQPWPQAEKNKAAMITRLDKYVGLIMGKLKELGEDKNTMVIFTSDNGPHKEGGVDPRFFRSGGPLRGIKRDLYEGGIREPMIVWCPGRGVKAGSTSDLPCAFWDFLPTVADLAKAPPPENIDGISFLPTLVGRAQKNRHEFLYWEFHEDGFTQALRMGDWKAVRFGVDGPLELYDLKNDVGEKFDVAKENPEVVAKIQAYLKTARTPDENWPVKTAAETSKKQHDL